MIALKKIEEKEYNDAKLCIWNWSWRVKTPGLCSWTENWSMVIFNITKLHCKRCMQDKFSVASVVKNEKLWYNNFSAPTYFWKLVISFHLQYWNSTVMVKTNIPHCLKYQTVLEKFDTSQWLTAASQYRSRVHIWCKSFENDFLCNSSLVLVNSVRTIPFHINMSQYDIKISEFQVK